MSLVYIFLADGFEEVEGLTSVDLLRRAGVEVRMISVTGQREITGARGIHVVADELFENVKEEADMLVLPGGMPGTIHLREHEALGKMLLEYDKQKKWIAAICAAPSVFGKLGILKDRNATSYPTCLDDYPCGKYLEDAVVIDNHVITSRGVATAIDFALALIQVLVGEEKADEVAASILYER